MRWRGEGVRASSLWALRTVQRWSRERGKLGMRCLPLLVEGLRPLEHQYLNGQFNSSSFLPACHPLSPASQPLNALDVGPSTLLPGRTVPSPTTVQLNAILIPAGPREERGGEGACQGLRLRAKLTPLTREHTAGLCARSGQHINVERAACSAPSSSPHHHRQPDRPSSAHHAERHDSQRAARPGHGKQPLAGPLRSLIPLSSSVGQQRQRRGKDAQRYGQRCYRWTPRKFGGRRNLQPGKARALADLDEAGRLCR